MQKFAAMALTMIFATSAFAHSKVDTTTPADGAAVDSAPAEINMDFANDIRLTRVEMTFEDTPSVPLELGAQTSFGKAFILPLQDMGQGAYRIDWRGLGADGHAMQGAFTFTVE